MQDHIYPEEYRLYHMERLMAQKGVSGYGKPAKQTRKELDEVFDYRGGKSNPVRVKPVPKKKK